MWGQSQSDETYRRRLGQNDQDSNLHNVEPGTENHLSQDTTAAPSPIQTPLDRSRSPTVRREGTWGEHDVGGPISREEALADYDALRREISRLSVERTKSRKSFVRRFSSARPRSQSFARSRTRSTVDPDVERDGEPPDTDEDIEDFDIGGFIKDGCFEARTPEGGATKKVGVVFKNLTVKGVGSSAIFIKTLPQAVMGTFGPDLYNLITRFVPALHFGRKPPTRDLIRDFNGVVRAGEMLLVLGRPGAGCSTFLKAIANQRESFAAIEGEVSYGGISAADQRKHYRGEVNYNPEDDQHLPNLTVWQTFKFALMNKTKEHHKSAIPLIAESLMKMFRITHTRDTLVGDEFVRGVSGGERKRVGIAETLATKSTVVCFDSSTRGLDASTALDFAQSLRVMTDVSNRTTLATLYQAGEGIYDVMDKVLVVEQGRMIYQGPARKAKQYFLDLGFYCPDRQTTADFLSSVGDPSERQFQSGKEASTPKTPDELEAAFKSSQSYKAIIADIESYEKELRATSHADTVQFKETVDESKSNSHLLPPRSSYTVSFPRQVIACARREAWLFWGDKTTLYTKTFIIIANALIVSSLFYGESLDTSGAFSRGGALFFSILFLGWLQLAELMKAVSGRVVIQRHKEYAFYRPSAVVIARVLLDLPVLAVEVAIFGIIVYFMCGLVVDAGKFFIYQLFIYVTTICITALYRAFASLSPTIDDAVRFAGTALNLLIVFVGYVIPKQTLVHRVPWFGTWLFYTNPIGYAYEGVMANEFSGRVMQCAPELLVPSGPGFDPRYQGCALIGAQIGSPNVSGSEYISASFQYTRSHLWRNFGVVVAWTVLYILVTALASEFFAFAGSGGGATIFKRSKKAQQQVAQADETNDEEKISDNIGHTNSTSTDSVDAEKELPRIAQSESVFTWENVEYTVPYGNGTRKLLNNVNGYVKPGLMIALMGASGAGKTTLLNTLAQRQRMGIVGGEMLVDGQALDADFQRRTGFCEQMDLHEGTATVREALEFSALLRQDAHVPKQEKLAYVDEVITLLELHDLEDAIIMSLGVEQRKRLTIGVELAAKPSLLLFLDEPTSGLDSQSAFSIIRFLKKLSRAGQAILCTIHQPSSILVEQFDMILALNPGGNTFYFGPVGENGSAVVDYFAKRGTQCPPGKNIAEFLLETAAKGGTRGEDGKRRNWNKEWRQSEENGVLIEEIRRLKQERNEQVSRSRRSNPHNDDQASKNIDAAKSTAKAFAAPILVQTKLLTYRTMISTLRSPSYLYAKLFVAIIVGLFNGFTFFNLSTTYASLQSRLFTCFLILLIPPTVVNGVLPRFFMARSLWEFREHPSRIYGWFAFCTAQIVAEIPWAIISGTIYWITWYLPTSLPRDASTAGYVYLMTILFFLFMSSWGQWICAFAPSFTVISNVLPFFFVMVSLFNGVVRPYAQLPVFWRYWMYYVNPSTWWIGGVLSAVLKDTPVNCTPEETTHFRVPPGESCVSYAGQWLKEAGKGYLLNPNTTSANGGICEYCPYASGPEYLKTIKVSPQDKWRDFGVFLVFVVTNWLLIYFFIYFVRVKGFTFGMGPLFGGLGKVVDKAAGAVKKALSKKSGPNEAAATENAGIVKGASAPKNELENKQDKLHGDQGENVKDVDADMGKQKDEAVV